MPRDTKTRYQAIFARHKQACALERGEDCDCKPSYYGKVYDRATRKHRKTRMFPSLAMARQQRNELESALQSGALIASSTMRLSAAIEAYLRAIESGRALNKHGRPYKPTAIRDLQGALGVHVKPVLGGRRITDVRRSDVQQLVNDMAPRLSGSRVRTVVNAIHSLYAWAQDLELAVHDPAARVRLPAMNAIPRERVATPHEMGLLLKALEIKDALPFALAVYATARRAEIRHARVEDVDLKLGVVYLGVDERGRKSRAAQRAVPIAKPLRVIVRQALLARGLPAPDELLCAGSKPGGRNSGMLSFEALQARADERWQPTDEDGKPITAAKVGDRITAHECRHTCATWLDAAGVRPVVASRLMGHALPERQAGVPEITQQRYTHTLPGDLERARDLLDAYLLRSELEATG
jgi:integrase